jgi:tetratricopeptide (TPR) repeat protein
MRRRSNLIVAAALFVASPVLAQGPSARQELQLGIAAVERGDTLDALARLERAIELDGRFAEAHYWRGLIFANRASAKATEFGDRLQAQQSFERAIHSDPGNPRYMLELGKLMLKQQMPFDAKRVFGRALDAAARADPSTLAETHFQIGVMYETQFQRYHYRKNLPIGISEMDADQARVEPRYVWRLLNNSSGGDPSQGENERENMLQHFRSALQLNAQHVGATLHLLAYHYDENQMEEFIARARRAVRDNADAPLAHLALGLGLHRKGREVEAAAAFR